MASPSKSAGDDPSRALLRYSRIQAQLPSDLNHHPRVTVALMTSEAYTHTRTWDSTLAP